MSKLNICEREKDKEKLCSFWKYLLQLSSEYFDVCKKQSSPATRHGGVWGKRWYSSYSFLTSALDGGEWSASRPGRDLPLGKGPGTHCTGGWVGPRAGLDTEDRGKILCPCRGSNPDLYWLSYPGSILMNVLSKNINIIIHRNRPTFVPVGLHDCETWSLTIVFIKTAEKYSCTYRN
jgi:hypothetical protein